jgi:UTP:GlnB (protein PII) uridylyltransferase
MFHDIEKRIDLPNRGKDHPEKGAKIIVEEFDKFGFNEKDLFSMHQIVKNHHWISRLNKGDKTKEEIALEFKDCPDAFNIEILLSKADIKAGGKIKYINEFSEIFHPIVTSEIKEIIKDLNS